MRDHFARQMRRQRATRRLQHIGCGHRLLRRVRWPGGLLFLQILQRQFKLGDGDIQSLRGAAKVHAPQVGKLGLQTGNRRRLCRDQQAYFVRQSG
jgi:hypothetical protein